MKSNIWISPIYRFRLFDGRSKGRYRYKEIVVDVTGSAPSEDKPGKLLSGVLNEAIEEVKLRGEDSIVDFGAGKLRNSHYLMKKGFRVYAVEFQQLAGKTPQAKALWATARKFSKKFKPIIFPHEFADEPEQTSDLALIINTLSIMPVPAERLLVLRYLHKSLRNDGHLLWYGLKGDEDQTNRCHPSARLGDGYYTGTTQKLKKFWREYSVDEINEMMQGAGFYYVRSFDTQGNSQARLYKRDSFCPLEPVLTQEFVAARRPTDDGNIPDPQSPKPRTVTLDEEVDEIVPDPPGLSMDSLCIDALKLLKPAHGDDHRFHRLVAFVFQRLFFPELRNQKIEEPVGLGRADIVMSNRAKQGFFETVTNKYAIRCPLVFIECKNYGTEVGNPEISQLLLRMNPRRGCLGFLVYRRCENREKLIERCKDATHGNNYILALADKDLIELLEMRRRNEREEMHDWLDDRFNELLL